MTRKRCIQKQFDTKSNNFVSNPLNFFSLKQKLQNQVSLVATTVSYFATFA